MYHMPSVKQKLLNYQKEPRFLFFLFSWCVYVLLIIHNHTQKQSETKFTPRIKLNRSMYIKIKIKTMGSQFCFSFEKQLACDEHIFISQSEMTFFSDLSPEVCRFVLTIKDRSLWVLSYTITRAQKKSSREKLIMTSLN